MVDKIFDITWIPLTYHADQFVGISHCPGKYSKDSASSPQLDNDLKSLRYQKVDVIISLISKRELKSLGMVNFEEKLKNSGFIHFVEPIDDFSIPKDDRIPNVLELIKEIHNQLKNNKSVLVHCGAGLGRSGIIVALIIKFIGSFKDPVGHLRKFRSGAVETEEQKRFISDFKFFDKD